MDRSSCRRPCWRRFVCRLGLAGLPLLGVGCVEGALAWLKPPPPSTLVLASHSEPSPAAFPGSSALPSPSHEGEGREAAEPPIVPISMDTVFRLAEDQNLQVAQARARVHEAIAQQDLASRWLPDLYVGTSYYRHEGGIQLQQGPLINSSTGAILSGLDIHGVFDPRQLAYQQVTAARKAQQQKAELSRITSEKLLDAATTYIDLLTALSGKAINRNLQTELQGLLDKAQKLAAINVGEAQVAVPRFRAELENLKRSDRRLDGQRAAASTKLVYLLSLDPCSQVLPLDGDLVPFHLVDSHLSTCDLVTEAQQHGPGIQELASVVALVEDAITKAKGPSRFLPTFEARAIDGAFGAGPGANLTWANRFDMALQMRWNLSNLATRCERSRIAEAQRSQAHLAYEDLRAKLTAGVREAHDTIVASGAEIEIGQEEIRQTREAQRISRELQEKALPDGITKMFDSLGALGKAQLNYLMALRDYDKAQIRLLVLLGCSAPPPAPAANPSPVDVGQAK